MAEEEKKPEAAPGGGEGPAAPASGSAPGSQAPPKPAAPAAPPKPPSGPAVQPWDNEMVKRVRERFGAALLEASTYLGQNFFVVEAEQIGPLCTYLKRDEQFNMLTDVTVVDYPKRPQRFEVVYQLYSFPRNERLRVKVQVAERIASVTSLWEAANWLEREAYDMFGVRFEGHPDLRRILLPEDWEGHPLRKDYGIIQQDVKWVQENLQIESGQ